MRPAPAPQVRLSKVVDRCYGEVVAKLEIMEPCCRPVGALGAGGGRESREREGREKGGEREAAGSGQGRAPSPHVFPSPPHPGLVAGRHALTAAPSFLFAPPVVHPNPPPAA